MLKFATVIGRHVAYGWLVIVLSLIAFNANTWLVQHRNVNTDIMALLPRTQQDPVLQQAFQNMVDTAEQRVVVLIKADNWPQALQAAKAYESVMQAHASVLHKDTTPADSLLTQLSHSRSNLLTPIQQRALQQQPPTYWSQVALARLYNPFGSTAVAWSMDPFGLYSDWLLKRGQETPVRPRDGQLCVESDGHFYAVLLWNLQQPAFAMATQAVALPLLAKAKAAALATSPQVMVHTGGLVLHAAAASKQASRDMSTIGVGSLLGIVLLIALTFTAVQPLLVIALSLGVGAMAALAVCTLVFGQIHVLTLVFGMSLLGIAQDYALYFLCSRASHVNASLSSRQLLTRLLPGLLLTLVAALIGYLALALTPFPGLRQMAVFSSVGLVFAWLTVLCWFPVLVKTVRVSRLAHLYNASLQHWPRFSWNRYSIYGLCLFLMVAACGFARLSVSDDIRALQKPAPLLIADQLTISRVLDAPSPVQFYIVRGPTEQSLLQHEQGLTQQLAPLISQQVISGFQALSAWVPAFKTQLANHDLIMQLFAEHGAIALVSKQLSETPAWQHNMTAQAQNASVLLTPTALLAASGGAMWHYLWLGKIKQDYASIVALRGLNDYRHLPLLASIHSEGVQWVDKVAEISSIMGHYRQTMSGVIVLAYAAIYALLFLRYRRSAWRLLAPPLVASISCIALLGFLGMALQLFHVLALLLILALGVDYAIFLREQMVEDQSYAWLTVGLSALSALLAFGLLALSNTPPLHAFGWMMTIGMCLVWWLAPYFSEKK